MERHPAVLGTQGPGAGEDDLARGHELVQHGGPVVHHTLREHERLPRGRRDRHPGELVDHGHHPVQPAQLVPLHGVLPRRQERGVRLRVHRLHVRAQGRQRTTPQGPQHLDVAPLRVRRGRVTARAERPLAHAPLPGQGPQRGLHHGGAQAQGLRGLGHTERPVRPGIPGDEVPHGIRDRFQERERNPHGQGLTERVPHPGGVLHRAVHLTPAHAQHDRAVGVHEGLQQLTRGLGGDRPVRGVLGPLRLVLTVRTARRQRVTGATHVPDPGGDGGARRLRRLGAGCRSVGRCGTCPGGGGPRGRRPRRNGTVPAQAQGGVVGGHGAEQAQQIRCTLDPAQAAVRGKALQLQDGGLDDLGVQQLAQLGAAQQLVEQGRVQGQCGGLALGQRGVALVEELRHVPEQQGASEGRGGVRGGLHHPQLPPGQVPLQLQQGGDVVHVLKAFAHRLQDDRELRVLPCDVQQLRRALALLPQRRALAGVRARQQKGAGCVLPEPGREQRGTAHLLGDDLLELLRLEEEQLRTGGLLVRGGHAQHDAVVRGLGGGIQTPALVQPGTDGQRPRPVHRRAERAVQHHAPVPELVPEALDHQRAVVGNVLRGLALLRQVRQQVVLRPLVQAGGGQALAGLGRRRACELAGEAPDGVPQLYGPPQSVPVPEGQLARNTRGRRHDHPVVRDLLDPPAGRTQGDHVPHAGLVDHLLVQLAHALGGLGVLLAHEEDGEQAAVRDRAAAGHRQAQRAGAGLQGAGLAVPHQAWAQLGELVGGVPPGEKVQHGVVRGTRQGAERGAAAHGVVPGLHVHVLRRDRGDGLLGEDVQGICGHAERLQVPREHLLRDHGGVPHVPAVLGVDPPDRHLAHLVPGAAHALKSRRRGERGLDLHHEVHVAHVDPQLQGGRGHHAAQPPGLQVLLDQGALVLGHRTVVRAREHGGGALVTVGLARDCGVWCGSGGDVAPLDSDSRGPPPALDQQAVQCVAHGHGIAALAVIPAATASLLGGVLQTELVDLVEPRGQLLREPARVGEDDRGAVRLHEVHDPLLHVRPDGRGGLLPGGVQVPVQRGGTIRGRRRRRPAQHGHVRDRHGDSEVPRLLGRGPHHVHGLRTAQEPGHGVHRLHGRREPDALRGPLQQVVEAFEAHRQVRAALGARHGVDLVDDHRVHVAQRLPRLGREHEVEGFRGGDEDVRRVGQQGAADRLRGVPGAHAHGDLRGIAPGGLHSLGDADQRRTQVALHIHAEGLERGDVEHRGAVLVRELLAVRARRGAEPCGRGLGRSRRCPHTARGNGTGRRGVVVGGARGECRRGLGAEQAVDGPQERGQCLAGAGGGHHEGVVARRHGLPCTALGGRGAAERGPEPLRGRRGEEVQNRIRTQMP